MTAAATRLVDSQLARDLIATLARLRMARTLDPKHAVVPGRPHHGCDLCTAERRLDWLLSQIPREGKR